MHPRLLNGEPITVCIKGEVFDSLFDLPEGLFSRALDAAVGDWNTELADLGRDALERDTTTPPCAANLADDDVSYIQVIDGRNCQVMRTCPHNAAGWVVVDGPLDAPPRVSWNEMHVFRSTGADADAVREELERVFRHELGHFLGLADYGAGCWRLIDDTGRVQPSLMSYDQLRDSDGNPLLQPDGPADPTALDPPGCLSATITTRDLDDLHAIYHPDAVTALALSYRADGTSLLSWGVPAGTPSAYNAASLGIFRRALLTRDPMTGAPAGPGAWGLLARSAPDDEEDDYTLPGDVGGYEYAVAGLTRGDHRRGSDVGPLGLRHGTVTLAAPTLPGGSITWTLGEASDVVSAAAPVGIYSLNLPVANYGSGGAGQWRFAVWGRSVTDYRPRHGGPVDIAPGDLIVSYGQSYTSFADSPFNASSFAAVNVQYGTTTIAVTACDTLFWDNDRYECLVRAAVTWEEGKQPLRVVATAAGTPPTRPNPVAGTYQLNRDYFSVANFGEEAANEWRFAFWGRGLRGYRPAHGGPVTINPGDIVLSFGQPYTSFADSPFDPNSFTPLRVGYGNTTITATSCDTHFWNNGRYECHIRGAFNWDAANIPADVTVNRAATTATSNSRGARAHADQDQAPDAPPTPPPTYMTTCPTWSNLSCGRPADNG